MEKKIDIKFQIKGVEIIEVQLNAPISAKPQFKTFNYKINIEHRIISEKKLVVNQVSIEIYGDAKEQVLLGKIMTALSFEINNFNDFADKGQSVVNLPESIFTTFNSIAISTTRGIMFSQFRGTYLHNAILPIVDPDGFKKQEK